MEPWMAKVVDQCMVSSICVDVSMGLTSVYCVTVSWIRCLTMCTIQSSGTMLRLTRFIFWWKANHVDSVHSLHITWIIRYAFLSSQALTTGTAFTFMLGLWAVLYNSFTDFMSDISQSGRLPDFSLTHWAMAFWINFLDTIFNLETTIGFLDLFLVCLRLQAMGLQ